MRALRAGLERGARFARRTGTGARFARRTGTGCALRAQNWNRCALRTQNWNRCALRTQNWNVIDSAFRVWSYGRDFARDCRPASSSVQCQSLGGDPLLDVRDFAESVVQLENGLRSIALVHGNPDVDVTDQVLLLDFVEFGSLGTNHADFFFLSSEDRGHHEEEEQHEHDVRE